MIQKELLMTVFLIFIWKASNAGFLERKRPNILFVISDDQSFPHTSFSGSTFINTPRFDQVAANGIYFKNCISASPGCAPSRSSIVTGRYPWQNEQSGQHGSSWMKKYVPFVDILEASGYKIGRSGKGVDPFQYARTEKDSLWRKENAAGKQYSNIEFDSFTLKNKREYTKGIGKTDHVANFKYFINNEKGNKPFFFWFGSHEPHRPYEINSYKQLGKKLKDAVIPKFLPDNNVIRGDFLDYAVEIEWFDNQLGGMLDYLDEIGELDNTIIIITSDNGKPFPSAKANVYEYGIHVPLAISFPKEFKKGKKIDTPVSLVDLAPTILEMTGNIDLAEKIMLPIEGHSLLKLLRSKEKVWKTNNWEYVLSGRERHSSSRYENLGYPQRAIRTKNYLLIWNINPERWPAGAPQKISDKDTLQLLPFNGVKNGFYQKGIAFNDIDESPSKEYLLVNASDLEVMPFYQMAIGKRPEFELFDIKRDPDCIQNLSGQSKYLKIEKKLFDKLKKHLIRTKDPRVVGPDKDIFDSYKRYMPIRKFPKPKETDRKILDGREVDHLNHN